MNSQQIYNALINIATKNDDTGEYTVKHEDISKLMTPKPKRGLTKLRAYMTQNKDDIKSKHPEKCKVQGGFLRMASEEWKKLDDDSQAEYILISEKDTDRYKREIAEYNMIFADKTKTKGKRGRPSLNLNKEEKAERAKKKKETKTNRVSNDSDDSDTEEISIIHVDGKDYYLDNNTNSIYDMNGTDIVGKKTDAGYTFD